MCLILISSIGCEMFTFIFHITAILMSLVWGLCNTTSPSILMPGHLSQFTLPTRGVLKKGRKIGKVWYNQNTLSFVWSVRKNGCAMWYLIKSVSQPFWRVWWDKLQHIYEARTSIYQIIYRQKQKKWWKIMRINGKQLTVTHNYIASQSGCGMCVRCHITASFEER